MSEPSEKKSIRRRQGRPRVLPTSSLIGMALQEWDSHASWKAIDELRTRCTPDTVERCLALFRSRNWRKRALAIDVMCQLHTPIPGAIRVEEYAVLQTHAMLLAALGDPSVKVIAAAAVGCGHRPSIEAIGQLVALATHPSSDVREGVTFGLLFRDDANAIDALVQLAGDSDEHVRNWATFGLTGMPAWDTPAIRERLWQNTRDVSDEVRKEALCALANRGDEQAKALLAQMP